MDYSAEGNYYVIGHVVQMTGLSERTIRNHIAKGFLKGEKINGLWHFTEEQVGEFMEHPAVRPGIRAKENGMVHDFLIDNKKKNSEICIILDVPEKDVKEIYEFFCNEICEGGYEKIDFSFSSIRQTPRVILKGAPEEVLRLINGYYDR